MHLVAIASYMTQNVQMEENISTLMDDGHTALEKGTSVRDIHISSGQISMQPEEKLLVQ